MEPLEQELLGLMKILVEAEEVAVALMMIIIGIATI
jgi:hypothetical protein